MPVNGALFQGFDSEILGLAEQIEVTDTRLFAAPVRLLLCGPTTCLLHGIATSPDVTGTP